MFLRNILYSVSKFSSPCTSLLIRLCLSLLMLIKHYLMKPKPLCLALLTFVKNFQFILLAMFVFYFCIFSNKLVSFQDTSFYYILILLYDNLYDVITAPLLIYEVQTCPTLTGILQKEKKRGRGGGERKDDLPF